KEFFDAVTVSGEVGIKKPDPLIFSQALRQTGLQPDEVAYVGDTLNDVRAARAAGLHPILIRRDDAGTAIMDYESGRQPAEGDPAGSLKNLEAGIISGLSSLIELLC
ncbi:MAG: HAD-IA family hydrolase, partial [Candidatus Zixiibacteriota bacterium]